MQLLDPLTCLNYEFLFLLSLFVNFIYEYSFTLHEFY